MPSDFDKGRKEFETGRWTRAYTYFQKAVKDEARAAEVRILMARCLLGMGDPESAERELKNVKKVLSDRDHELISHFEQAWSQMKETRKLTPAELEARRKASQG